MVQKKLLWVGLLILYLAKVYLLWPLANQAIEFDSYLLFWSPTVILPFYLLLYYYLDRAYRYEILALLLFELILPVFGVVFLSIFMVLYPLIKFISRKDLSMSDGFSEDSSSKRYINERETVCKDNQLNHQLMDQIQIEPFIDILQSNDLDLKLNVIEKLSRMDSETRIQLLVKALNDSDYHIRYFANNALGKIEERMMSSVEEVSEQIQHNPAEYQLYNRRAEVYLKIFYLGLLDRETAGLFLGRALEDYYYSLKLRPSQKECYLQIISINNRRECYQETLILIDTAKRLKMDDQDFLARLLFYQAEAYFHLKRFNQLREITDQITQIKTSVEKVRQISSWWSSSKESEEAA